jgi:transmembrane sensor
VINESDLLRFLEGECTPEEARMIQAWIAADPTRTKLLEELRIVWRLTGKTSRPWSVATAWERIRRNRRHAPVPPSVGLPSRAPGSRPERTAQPDPRGAVRSWSLGSWQARVAVAISLAIAGALYGYLAPRSEAAREYATAPGQRAEVSLRDGSRVLLSVDTRLRVPRDYGVHDRAVELDGEAYFVVRHDARRPMVVRTHHGIAEDLGTEFGVRAYHREDDFQVIVRVGSVAMRRLHDPGPALLTLGPGDRGVLDARGQASMTSHVPVDRYLSWTAGRLVFDDAPLGTVIVQLERWYDLDIQLNEASLGHERVTIVFTTESPDEALSTLAKVLDLRVMRVDRSVRLAPLRPRQ